MTQLNLESLHISSNERQRSASTAALHPDLGTLTSKDPHLMLNSSGLSPGVGTSGITSGSSDIPPDLAILLQNWMKISW